jgi:hypothetical protein
MDSPILSQQNPSVISRQEAKSLGLKQFFTGEPCLHGHISQRNVYNNGCLECMKIAGRIRRHGEGRPKCIIDGCSGNKKAKGLCAKHYKVLSTHGDPLIRLKAGNGEGHKWILDNLNYDGEDCLIWPFCRSSTGYGKSRWDGNQMDAHVIMCRLVNGEPASPSLWVAHSCNNGKNGCCHPKHLRWATPSENAIDRRIHGTAAIGAKNHFARLTEDEVREIRQLEGTMSRARIAKKFGVKRNTIYRIHKRISWFNLD